MSSYKNEIANSLAHLKRGETILYPTDTVWGIGCDATDKEAVTKIYQIKQRVASKSMIVLVSDLKMLQDYISDIPTTVLDIIAKTTKPTSIIYKNPKGLATNLIASDNTVGIRIVQDEFCQNLIKAFGKPIVSTSANISGAPTPTKFKTISKEITNSVDYVVPLSLDSGNKASKIIKINGSEIIVIRS